MARRLAALVNALHPGVFVIGGDMSNVEEIYDVVPEAIGRYTFSTALGAPIVKARHGDTNGKRGAVWLWQEDR
jgi:fructokinase